MKVSPPLLGYTVKGVEDFILKCVSVREFDERSRKYGSVYSFLMAHLSPRITPIISIMNRYSVLDISKLFPTSITFPSRTFAKIQTTEQLRL